MPGTLSYCCLCTTGTRRGQLTVFSESFLLAGWESLSEPGEFLRGSPCSSHRLVVLAALWKGGRRNCSVLCLFLVCLISFVPISEGVFFVLSRQACSRFCFVRIASESRLPDGLSQTVRPAKARVKMKVFLAIAWVLLAAAGLQLTEAQTTVTGNAQAGYHMRHNHFRKLSTCNHLKIYPIQFQGEELGKEASTAPKPTVCLLGKFSKWRLRAMIITVWQQTLGLRRTKGGKLRVRTRKESIACKSHQGSKLQMRKPQVGISLVSTAQHSNRNSSKSQTSKQIQSNLWITVILEILVS